MTINTDNWLLLIVAIILSVFCGLYTLLRRCFGVGLIALIFYWIGRKSKENEYHG